jgi:DNA repair protein RecN (Recombination protein N)
MLNELVVEGLGVIDRAELTLERGCCALTGETGAGKTMLVAALSLLLGSRADRGLVREGAAEARIEGRFTVDSSHAAATLLRNHGVIEEGAGGPVELIVARSVPADGRSGKIRINGRLVSVSLLEEMGALLAEIATQHAHRRLASGAASRKILDSFVGDAALAVADEVATAVRHAQRAQRRAEELRASERERRRELDLLRFEIDEIEAASVSVGESERLQGEATKLEHAETIAVGLAAARRALHGEGGADELAGEAARELERLSSFDSELSDLARRVQGLEYEISDIAAELATRATAPDPDALEEVRSRQSVLSRLKRKYGDDESAVLEYLEKARTRADELQSFDSDLIASEEEANKLELRARELALRLSELRMRAAPKLQKAVEKTLAELALPGARFEVALEDRPLHEGGLQSVELKVSANPGEAPRPLAKAASGGELSRISLALHVLTSGDTSETMVFDEVDAGVGGAAAHAVGRTLAELGARESAQVLVVTHLPQVAAHAHRHYRVTKAMNGGRVTTTVEEVRDEERIAELSRMLAGLPESERAREHAQELLDLATGRVGAA